MGARFVALCAKGLGHGFASLTNSDDVGGLEAAVEAHGGPEAARDFVASTCRSRPELDPVSETLLLEMLRDAIPGGARA